MKRMLNNLRKFRGFWWNGTRKRYHRNDEEYVFNKRWDDPLYIERYGYKVYSQNDEDGIITEIFNRIGTTNKIFVEFGVENGLECNGHYLLHKGWSGVWIEGSSKCCSKIEKLFSLPIKNGKLKITNSFIDRENINSIFGSQLAMLGDANKEGVIDMLSIDIDGNDYWVWEAINCVQPRVVVIEYNAKFPPDYEWIMRYDKNHIWQGDDECGASLKSLELLGRKLGYQLVGTNFIGVNAFFVKQDIANNHFFTPAIAENLYNPARYQSIYYMSGHPSKKYIGY